MSELYTTLVRVKMALNDGSLPPMTPIPEKIQHIINPEYVPGLGALNEDEEKGLQCPVCGVWKPRLSHHLNRSHREIGGAKTIKKLLGIPQTVSLWTLEERMKQSTLGRAAYEKQVAQGTWVRPPQSKAARRKTGRTNRRNALTVGERNFRNSCHAQLGHRLWDLNNKLGRCATVREAMAMDEGLHRQCVIVYGTWAAALSSHGIDHTHSGRGLSYNRKRVLVCLSAWVEKHGALPTYMESRVLLPRLPKPKVVRKHLEADSWPDAMKKAALHLNIYDARYRPEPKACA